MASRSFICVAAVLALTLAPVPGQAHDHAAMGHEPVAALPEPDYAVASPGTYELQRIMRSPDGTVLDTGGKSQPLSRYTQGKVTLLAFIFTHCSDVNGCPAAYVLNQQLKGAIEQRPALAPLRGKVRLVSLSFDPRHDTPEVMRSYGEGAGDPDAGVEWDFLTTSGPDALVPLLDGFGQDVSVAANAPDDTQDFAHMLKLFLLDSGGTVREIYSSAFLQPLVVLNDIQTLAMEQAHAPAHHHAARH